MFEKLKSKLSSFRKKAEEIPEKPEEALSDSGRKIDQEEVEELLWDLEVDLLEADVALDVVEEVKEGVSQALSGKRLERKYDLGDFVLQSLKSSVRRILEENHFDFDDFVDSGERPLVIMFVGINGTGKTTAIAKVAHRLQGRGMSCVFSASDTFRAGAIEQLSIHGESLGCKVIKHQAGGDPAAVAYDAVEHARARRKDVVLVDTAGRMQTNANLMDEMKKIRRVTKPHLVVFVGEALAGNDAIEQARAFDREVGIDAVILTKIDADARGGAALSIAHSTQRPIAFLSTGQGYEDMVKFDSQWMLDRIFS
ncbi:MAG: signal recognition particle-docking protein FtsY [Methanomassiliicoccales archaeon]